MSPNPGDIAAPDCVIGPGALMEISDIKRRVVETIERARRRAGERRVRTDDATREYEAFLDRIAVPVFKQVANVLRVEGYMFTVFTPGGSVRLMSDRSAEDYVELEQIGRASCRERV